MKAIKINRDFISKNNTYAGRNVPVYICIHETDNTARGAGARRHAEAQSLGHLGTSVQYYAGSDGIYQAAEHSDGTYSIGIEYGGDHPVHDASNRNTINIEICVNKDGDYMKARQNAIELVKHLMEVTGIPAGRVIRHFDAKGKYCPRKMMDSPELWEDFKRQVAGQPPQTAVKPENKEPAQPEENKEKEVWYRVGSGWKNGICQNQTGAYHNKGFAIADCRPGQMVFDEKGNAIHAAGDAAGNGQGTAQYTQKQFIIDVQKATGSGPDGIAGDETIGNTVTVSAVENRKHPVVPHIQGRLNALGYSCGDADGVAGEKFTAAVNAYQKSVLGYREPDGEVTARKKMWKSLLGML
jgi:hypothetical protein